MSLTFDHPIIAIFRRYKHEYVFLQFQAENHRWQLIEPPNIDGIVLIHNQNITDKKTFLTLHNGRRLDIKVSTKVLRGSEGSSQQWYQVVIIDNNGRLMSPNIRKLSHTSLLDVTIPENTQLGIWQAPAPVPAPIRHISVSITDNSIPPHIPSNVRSIFTLPKFTSVLNNGLRRIENPLITEQQRISRLGTAFINTAYTAIHEYTKSHTIPMSIAKLIIENTEMDNNICPITLDPIKKESCSITSCFHVFNKDAIAIWLSSNDTCPVCKQLCAITTID